MFKAIFIRSHEIRTAYAKNGEWSWNDSKYYIPLEAA
jgi:hypothetical protein